MNHSEQVARLIIEALTPGGVMEFVDDQSRSVCDFQLILPNRTTAAVEVTSAREPVELATIAAIASKKHGGQTIKGHQSQRSWLISPRSGANINLIRRDADSALAAVEAAGFSSFGPGATPAHEAIAHAANHLGIFFGRVLECGEPGTIRVVPPLGGGAVNARVVHDAVVVEAQKPDNRTKLGRSGMSERHLAIYVDPANHNVWVPLVDFPPPEVVVELPAEMSDVWVFSEARHQDRYVVWRAKAGATWVLAELGQLG